MTREVQRMPDVTLENRVEILEEKVEALAALPARVGRLEEQFLQLRQEMRDGFSAVRQEIREGDEETRSYMRVLHEDVIERIARIGEAPRRRPKR